MSTHSDIVILLDSSGSMAAHAAETTSSLDQFIADQAKVPGTANLTIYTFSSAGTLTEIMSNVPVAVKTRDHEGNEVLEATKLDPALYQPAGMTALNQSAGEAIKLTGARYKASTAKIDKRLFVIVTDGAENASQGAYAGPAGRARLKEEIAHQTTKYGWDFVFLAANMDAVEVGSTLGVLENACLSFETRKGEVTRGIGGLSAYTTSYRGT